MKTSFTSRTCTATVMNGHSTVKARPVAVMISDWPFMIMTVQSLFMTGASLKWTGPRLELNGSSQKKRWPAHGLKGAVQIKQATVLITPVQVMKVTGTLLDMNGPVTTTSLASLMHTVEALCVSETPRALEGPFRFTPGTVQMRTGTSRVRSFASLALTFASLVLTGPFTLLTGHFLSLADKRRHFHDGDLDEHPSR